MKRQNLIALSIVIALIIAGCAKPPETQVQHATTALAAAEAAGAPQYAPEAWGRAKQAADQMKAELDAQGKKLGLLRNYGKARSLAEQAAGFAEQALADANAKKAQLRGEVSAMIAEISASLEAARKQLLRLPKTKGLDVTALKSTLYDAGNKLDQARADLAGGALDRAMAVAAQAREAINGVFKAIEKATGVPASRKR
jgi:hypothetical protein